LKVLDGLSSALQLEPAARDHLLALAGVELVAVSEDDVDAELLTFLDALHLPAFAQNRFMDVLHANAAATAVFPYLSNGVNLLRLAFLDSRVAEQYDAWESVAADAVAHLRSLAGSEIGAPRMVDLLTELNRRSPQFRDLWAQARVTPNSNGTRRVRHAKLGELQLNFNKLDVPGQNRIQVVIYYPSPGSDSDSKLAELLAGR